MSVPRRVDQSLPALLFTALQPWSFLTHFPSGAVPWRWRLGLAAVLTPCQAVQGE